MAGGTKRLPRAVREQQMLDAAVQMFSVNGYHETSMDAIAGQAEISKPMLYLYYGSKEELFGACLDRELGRFVDSVRADIDFTQPARDLLRNAVVSFLSYIDANRASWMVLYTQATSSQAFAHTVREGRERIIDLVGRLLQSGTRHPEPDTDFDMMAVALVGAGEAVATRVSTGDADVHEAAELMINLFWRGLKGKPSERDAGGQERSDQGNDTGGQERSDAGNDAGGQDRSDPGNDAGGQERSDPGNDTGATAI